MIKIIEGECVREMDKMQRKSFDMIIADPPFGIDYFKRLIIIAKSSSDGWI